MRIADRRAEVTGRVGGAVARALRAMGQEARGAVLRQMESGYGQPIRETGALMGDVDFQVREAEKAVDIGCSLGYAVYVHEGTSRRAGTPFLRDGVAGATEGIRSALVAEFRDLGGV